MRLDPRATAVDLSRAAKQWQSIGEAKVAAGRNAEDRHLRRRLSSLLDAVGPFTKAEKLWAETAALLREAGGAGERSADVADQQARSCERQVDFCSDSVQELVLELSHRQGSTPDLALTRFAAYEYERHADGRSLQWLIDALRDDPVLSRPSSWGDDIDLWWLQRQAPSSPTKS